jgi:ABC-type branched-subunit amino acid transport system substrate-binding protein
VRLAPSDALEPAAAATLAAALGLSSLVVVGDGGPDGSALAARVARQARARKLVVTRRSLAALAAGGGAGPTAAERLFWRSLARVDGAGVFLAAAPGRRATAFLEARLQGTPKGKDAAALLLPHSFYSGAALQAEGDGAEGAHVLFPEIPAEGLRGASGFVQAYTARYGAPGVYAVYAGQAAELLLDALSRSHGSAASVAAALVHGHPRARLLGRLVVRPDGALWPPRYGAFAIGGGRFHFDRILEIQ